MGAHTSPFKAEQQKMTRDHQTANEFVQPSHTDSQSAKAKYVIQKLCVLNIAASKTFQTAFWSSTLHASNLRGPTARDAVKTGNRIRGQRYQTTGKYRKLLP
jgi:hypothetical protein